jgi:anthranilate synthase component 1
MNTALNLTKEEFLQHAATGKVIPLYLKLFGGNETPVGLYEKLSEGKTGTFLLESAEQGVWSRYSFIGVNSRASILETESELLIVNRESLLPNKSVPSIPALELIKLVQSAWTKVDLEDLPPLTSGLVGLFSWDVIRDIEKLEPKTNRDYESPKIHLQMVQDLVVVDHKTNSLLLVSNVYCEGEDYEHSYELAAERIEKLFIEVQRPIASEFAITSSTDPSEIKHNTSKQDFLEAVDKAKGYVRIGDVFQVVISQRFDLEVSANPLDVYRVLRTLNPSPYMYLLNFADKAGSYSVVGSSPEALVKVSGERVVMHPIAGSRPRGTDSKTDQDYAESLLADAKEKAEHLMLVDLARNDLLKVCQPSSVTVTEFMKIERFSHIMHLVSTVEGNLSKDQTPVDVFKATFPAGTLSGAPKPRALEIIDELETSNRGIFGGVVGYLDFDGNADLAIAIRTSFIRDGVARVQAGAGIVLDSVPEAEYQETVNKASAVIAAISQANAMFGTDKA